MNNLLLIGNLGTGEILIIALIVLLLFGGKKIPELMRGLGKGVKSFKDGMSDVEKEIKDVDNQISSNDRRNRGCLIIRRCLFGTILKFSGGLSLGCS